MSDRILLIDTETTGMIARSLAPDHSAQPRIVQLAAILMRPDGGEEMCLNTLIRPDGWTIHPKAHEVHKIGLEECHRIGWPIRSALSYVMGMARSAARVVAHNADFDVFMLAGEFARIGHPSPVPKDVYCTMQKATDIVRVPKARGGGWKWPKLNETYRHFFGTDFEGAHDALADVRACAKCYFEIVKVKP